VGKGHRKRGEQFRKPKDLSAKVVSCPKCRRVQVDRGPIAIYWCEHCQCQFDNDPDEGDYHDRNPAARLEREERRRFARR
jgi:ribosomal protein L37AE/L43A